MKKLSAFVSLFFMTSVALAGGYGGAWGGHPKDHSGVTNVDADTLDGIDSADFVRNTGAQTITGVKTFSDTTHLQGGRVTISNSGNDGFEISPETTVIKTLAYDRGIANAYMDRRDYSLTHAIYAGSSPTVKIMINGSGVTINGELSHAKSCAVGYTRAGANYCSRDIGATLTALTTDACTTISAPAGDAVAIQIEGRAMAATANTSGSVRNMQVMTYDGAACTGVSEELVYASGWEDAAETLVRYLDVNQATRVYPVALGASIFIKASDDTGNNGLASYRVVGYYD